MADSAHSKFSASAASRWISCPGSMVLSVGKVDQRSSYAADGSAMHDVADACLQSKADPAGYLGREVVIDGTTVTITQDMVECVTKYLEHVEELTAGADIVQSETRTNYAKWLGVPHDSAWGTADCTAAWIDLKHLLVADLKTGRGVQVDAENNEQGMLYAGGKLLEMDDLGIEIETIDIVISQPRVNSAPSVWKITTSPATSGTVCESGLSRREGMGRRRVCPPRIVRCTQCPSPCRAVMRFTSRPLIRVTPLSPACSTSKHLPPPITTPTVAVVSPCGSSSSSRAQAASHARARPPGVRGSPSLDQQSRR